MEAKTDIAVNKIFAGLFSSRSGFADDQRHIPATTQKRKWILKNIYLYISAFKKMWNLNNPTERRKEKVSFIFIAETEHGTKCRKINQNRQINKNFLV